MSFEDEGATGGESQAAEARLWEASRKLKGARGSLAGASSAIAQRGVSGGSLPRSRFVMPKFHHERENVAPKVQKNYRVSQILVVAFSSARLREIAALSSISEVQPEGWRISDSIA